MNERDKYRGCLIGGAAGDALGYAVEFIGEKEIFRCFGERGITRYALTRGEAYISDDTQMTLFTAAGLLAHKARNSKDLPTALVNESYKDWLITQNGRYPLKPGRYVSWLMGEGDLFCPRAPGNTCLAALRQGGGGTPDDPINNSKGCGGVMRAAPAGLFFCGEAGKSADAALLGARVTALTHGHPLGWLPGAALAQIVYEVVRGERVAAAAAHALDTIDALWPDAGSRVFFRALMEKAAALAEEGGSDLDAIHALGEGWTGDEAMAIALYCAIRYEDDIDRALIAAVNHKGDSDSTGAVAGNIVGARVGLDRIPEKYLEKLELRQVILTVADDLWRAAFPGEDGEGDAWTARYQGMIVEKKA
ncbi:MAG: ADP-ribosylglycohydrolase family protein [Clostridia bacterium]|nr:ADP-ribosylglycohydrolase family protein [Clostridia bacterium]